MISYINCFHDFTSHLIGNQNSTRFSIFYMVIFCLNLAGKEILKIVSRLFWYIFNCTGTYSNFATAKANSLSLSFYCLSLNSLTHVVMWWSKEEHTWRNLKQTRLSCTSAIKTALNENRQCVKSTITPWYLDTCGPVVDTGDRVTNQSAPGRHANSRLEVCESWAYSCGCPNSRSPPTLDRQ